MKEEESITQKAVRLKKLYGVEKSIEIITNDMKRFSKNKAYAKSEGCRQVLQQLRTGMI